MAHLIAEGGLHGILDQNASVNPSSLALRFLRDGEQDEETFSWSQLAEKSTALAAKLRAHSTAAKPVIIGLSSGPSYIISLFACWRAGAIAVPAMPPMGTRHAARLTAIARDCGAQFAILDSAHTIPGLTAIAPDEDAAPPLTQFPKILVDSPCLIQYTSGSTSQPKGVVLHHTHFLHHAHSIHRIFGSSSPTHPFLSWLPPWHDMGLVLKILQAAWLGCPLTLMAPDHFIQRPMRWLEAISRYNIGFSGGPNFAYEACARSARAQDIASLDLSSWKLAPCGAERIRPDTLHRFAKTFAPCGFDPAAWLPGYGLAEATLTVTAPSGFCETITHPTAGPLISCGTAAEGLTLRITDPHGHDLPDGCEGEIRVKGPSIAAGYWNRPEDTLAIFGPPEQRELRTGDLGFLRNGQLFICGRIKDLIILDGVNFAPEDIESAAYNFHPEIRAAAAFAQDHGEESITLLLETGSAFEKSLIPALRSHIAEQTGAPVHRIALTRPGLLPRTTSGKIQRYQCREKLAAGVLRLSYDDAASIVAATTCSSTEQAEADPLSLVLTCTAEVTGKTDLRADDDLARAGIGSLDATRIAALLREKTGRAVSIHELFAARSLREFAGHLSSVSQNADLLPTAGVSPPALTRAQERMWFLHQADPASAAYNVYGAIELDGTLDAALLRRAFTSVTARHDILTSRHGIENGKPLIWHEPGDAAPFDHVSADGEAEARALLSRFGSRPFDLAGEAPLRGLLICLSPRRHILALSVHHIAADGSAMRVLAGELATAYQALRRGIPADLPPPPSYAAYAARHRAWSDGLALDAQLAWWKDRLAGHPGVIDLPVDFPHPARPSAAGGYAQAEISPALVLRIAALASAHGITPFMLHLAAFALFLRHHGCGGDLVIAVPVANRNHSSAFSLVGTLVNTLPLRLHVPQTGTLADWFREIRAAVLDMLDHQDAPFERIIGEVQPARVANRSPLAQVMIDHQNLSLTTAWDDSVSCRTFPSHRGASQFDLSLMITEFGGRQEIGFEFRRDLFHPETVDRFLARHLQMLEKIAAAPEIPLAEISLMIPADQADLARISQGPHRLGFTETTTPALIAERCRRHPEKAAVISAGTTLAYSALADHAGAFAAWLAACAISPGERVAVLVERDALLPALLLAIWKRGAAYVPLDPSNPPARLALILADQAPLKLVLSPALREKLPANLPDGVAILSLDNTTRSGLPPVEDNLPSPDSPAYVIHTSGSTGAPKGVVITHGALANFLRSMAEIPGFTEADHLLAVTTISFDISLLEIFLPLVCGGTVEVLPGHVTRDAIALRDHLAASRATVMQATPATWRMLVEAGWKRSPDLKLLCGGEAMDDPLARDLAARAFQVWNLYGPTETTVWSAISRVTAENLPVTIGKPIANTGVHITDAAGRTLPPGVPGHLRISGAGLAQGYWNQPALTSARFTTITTADGQTTRAYDTGDIARWDHAGNLLCLGRSDHQIKIRGFRVEPGEIESAILTHPGIAQARVALRGEGGSARLVAWFVPSPAAVVEVTALRKHLATALPPHMIPADIGAMTTFPLNASGKVDLNALPDPAPAERACADPATETEARLIAIWREILSLPAISPEDDWFHIGGHSIQALRMFARVHRDFGKTLPFSTLLTASTPRTLAAAIDR